MKKTGKKIIKSIIWGVLPVIFVTIGIDAADHYSNYSESIVGRVLSGEEEGPCPENMVQASTDKGNFCIDKYEASAGPKCTYGDPSTQDETRLNLESVSCIPVSNSGAKPWRLISQDQAELACTKAGKRLATNEEWLKAALGTPDAEDNWTQDDCQVANNWTSQPGLTGSGKKCISAAGAYDMVGNVWEWVKGTVQDGSYEGKTLPESGYIDSTDGASMPGITNPNQPNKNYNDDYYWLKNKGLRGIVRGGYWNNKSDAGQYSMYIVTPPSSVEAGIGFRCAK